MKRLIASILISAMIIFGLPLNAPVIRENIGERFAQVFTTPDASAAWVFRNFSGTNKAAVFSTVKFTQSGFFGNNNTTSSIGIASPRLTAGQYNGLTPSILGLVSYAHVKLSWVLAGDLIIGLYDSSNNRVAYGKLTIAENETATVIQYNIPLVSNYILTNQEYKLLLSHSVDTDWTIKVASSSGWYAGQWTQKLTDPPQTTYSYSVSVDNKFIFTLWVDNAAN